MGAHLCIAKESAAQDTVDGVCDLHVGGQGLRCNRQIERGEKFRESTLEAVL